MSVPNINGVQAFLTENGVDIDIQQKMTEIDHYLATHNNNVNVNEVLQIINRGITDLSKNTVLMDRLRSIWTETGDIDLVVQRNEELKRQILAEKAQNYFLINQQNLSLEDGIKRMMKESTTDNKQNYYQLEQNKNIHYIYKLMFWFYYLFVLVFILVFFILSKTFFVTKVIVSALFIVFPFLILPLEYIAVFVYYYLYSFVMAVPFKTAELPISMPTHTFEYIPANVLDFKNF